MATYLLTFNPKKGNFSDYDEAVKLTSKEQPYYDNWSVNSGQIARGDRVFILRQGKRKPTGIMAEGFVTKGSYKSPANRDGTGKPAFRVDIKLGTVLGPDEQPIPWPLAGQEHAGKYRGPFGSGNSVTDEIAKGIEDAWLLCVLPRQPAFDLSAALMGQPLRVIQDIQQRQGQSEFRAGLLQAYGNRCGLSDCDVEPALEAAHIVPYSGAAANHVQNGILLRADLHTLFDLNLFVIDPEMLTVEIDVSLQGTSYNWLSGKLLNEPHKPEWRPSAEALRYRARTKAQIRP